MQVCDRLRAIVKTCCFGCFGIKHVARFFGVEFGHAYFRRSVPLVIVRVSRK